MRNRRRFKMFDRDGIWFVLRVLFCKVLFYFGKRDLFYLCLVVKSRRIEIFVFCMIKGKKI